MVVELGVFTKLAQRSLIFNAVTTDGTVQFHGSLENPMSGYDYYRVWGRTFLDGIMQEFDTGWLVYSPTNDFTFPLIFPMKSDGTYSLGNAWVRAEYTDGKGSLLKLDDSTITYQTSIQYTLTIASSIGGSTNPVAGTYTYNADDSATVSAIPDQGMRFDHWDLDGIAYTDNPITILMDANHVLTPYFIEETQPPIDYTPLILIGVAAVAACLIYYYWLR